MSLATFQRMLLIRSWCPDRVTVQARKYISESLSPEYAEGVILDLKAMWEESTIRTPMICFLTLGSDPSNQIEALAKRQGFGIYLLCCLFLHYLVCLFMDMKKFM
jgi:dynein heavy chain